MRVVVTAESRFTQTPDGRTWTTSGPDYAVWARYLSVFDRVRVVGWVVPQSEAPDGANRVDGDCVEVWPVPHYQGLVGYLRRGLAVRRAVSAAATPADAVILRVPSPIGSRLARARRRLGRPYALEVIQDPYDVFAPGVVRHPLRPLLRRRWAGRLRHQCRSAAAVGYETDRTLQARYPAGAVPTASVSCVDLPRSAYVTSPRGLDDVVRPSCTLVSVGSLDQPCTGIDTLITALKPVIAQALPARLVHVGVGRYQPALEKLAARLHITDRVTFAGSLPPAALRRQLDAADLFVLPSRTERLPRALIEAMARGLPAIATTVGAVPELLPPEDLVAPDDAPALADAIHQMLTDPPRMAAASARNLARAHDFSARSMAPKRAAYYQAVREVTEREKPVGSHAS